MDHRTCLILTGGDPALLPDRIPDDIDLVVAADAGAHLAEPLGLKIDVLVGDFDSVRPEVVDGAARGGAIIERHPIDKDATDLQLALEAARSRHVGRAIVIGGTALERIDHLLANASVIASPTFADMTVEWWVGPARLIVGRRDITIEGAAGDLVSIIPVGGDAEVTTTGLRWPLLRERLRQGDTRGVANEMLGGTAALAVSAGTAFVIHIRRSR